MKIKKSKFAKLLTLALPIAAISIVTPVVLTSCGSSNSTTTPDKPDNGGSGGGSDTGGGGSSGDGGTSGGGSGSQTPSVVTASWNTTKFNGDLIKLDSSNNPVITLTNSDFAGTGLTKISPLDTIKQSLTPSQESLKTKNFTLTKEGGNGTESTTKTTLYSLLSPAINNLEKFNLSVNINPNDVVFDYTNDNVANTIKGEFVLTPKAQTREDNSQNKQILSFTIQNFNDSYNGENGKQLTWDKDKIKTALTSTTEGSGNKLPEVDVKPNGATAIIDLKDQNATLTQVMYELSNTSISSSELKGFFVGDTSSFKLDNATISGWALSVDHSRMFTRIVIPSATDGGQEAILYIVYTGYTYENISGSPIWNRNIPYFDAKDVNSDLWDKKYNEPVIDLTNTNINFKDTSGTSVEISKNSNVDDIKAKSSEIAQYVASQYLMGYDNFSKGSVTSSNDVGSFNNDGIFNANKKDSKSLNLLADDNILSNNNNVIQIRVLLKPNSGLSTPTDDNNLYGYNKANSGFWKAFYIVGYSV